MAGRRVDSEPKLISLKYRKLFAGATLSVAAALGLTACDLNAPVPESSPTPSPAPSLTATSESLGAFGQAQDSQTQAETQAAMAAQIATLQAELTSVANTPVPPNTEVVEPSPTASLTPSPTATPTPTEAYASLYDHPDFQGVEQGSKDETMVLDNSDVALRGPEGFATWLNTMKDAEARFPDQLSQQVPFWNIFQHEVPVELRDNPESPVLLGLWNPKVNRTRFETTRLNYSAANPESLQAADIQARSLLTQVEFNGETRWAFTAPLDQLKVEGLVVPSADGLMRGFAFGEDFEASQMLLALQNAAFIEAAEDAQTNDGQRIQLTDEQRMAAAFQSMHNGLIEQGWDDSGFMPVLYLDQNGDVQQAREYLRNIPMQPVGRVQMMPAPTTNREDQTAGIVCVTLHEYENLSQYGTQIDAGSRHLVLNVVDARKMANELASSGAVRALEANNRLVLAHLISEEENAGYQNIPQNDSNVYSNGFEVAPELLTNRDSVEDPFGTTLYEDCEPAPAAPEQPVSVPPVHVPPGPEVPPPPGVTPPPEFTPPPQETPRVTPLPTNDPITAPTRGPVEPDWNPTLVATPRNTPVPATEVPQQNPPTPEPQQEEPTPVF